ncbi:MAG: TlpA disulfide reductase family protein [Bacteroidota bacterium]
MKPPLNWILSLLLISISPILYAQSIKFSPKKVSPGDKVTITYKPKGGELEGKEVNGSFAFVGDIEPVYEIKELGKKDTYTVELQLPDSALAFAIQFSEVFYGGTLEYEDYHVLLVEKGNKEILQGAYGSLGEHYGKRFYSPTEEILKGKPLIEKEWELWPESRNKYWYGYALIAAKGDLPQALEKVSAYRDDVLQNTASTEEKLNEIYRIVRMTDGEPANLDSVANLIIGRFPKGEVAAERALNDFYYLPELSEQEVFYADYQEKYKQTEFLTKGLQSMASDLVRGFAYDRNWEKTDEYLALLSDKRTQSQILNEIARRLGGETLEGYASDLEKAGELSQRALNLIQQEISNHEPDSEGNDFLAFSMELEYASYLDTYALVSYKQGEKDRALALQQEAMDKSPSPDPGMTDRYFVYLQEDKSPAEMISLIEERIIAGEQTTTMMELHKKLMFESMSVNDIYQRYMGMLSKERLKLEMMDQEAPLFTLTDLDENTVSLEELRGKVVVLDFWATWCAPCIASFPGMNKAREKYADRNDVVFLFLNTWERVDDPEQMVKEFVQKKGYDFQIPMDVNSEIVEAYGVTGIPSKFIIDKSGTIRFSSVGYEEDENKLVEELSTMIELAAQQTENSLSIAE